uniref:Hsp20/alpha crystallin family protein n=1 Tax=Thermorudis peleae TaxID=1382356 RepID=A0A831TIQ7_9BACT
MLIIRRRGRHETGRIQQEMAEVFQSWVVGFRPLLRSQAGVWRPPTEVFEDEHGLVVRVEVAGVRDEDLQVVVDDAVLRISGIRRPRDGEQRKTYHEMGIFYGPFMTEVLLPFAIELDAVEAVYEQGLLQVSLPRVRASRVVPLRTAELAPEEE